MIMGGKHGRARMGPVVEALDNSERGGDINGGQEEEEVEEDGIVETRLGGRGRLVSCGEVQHRNCTLAAAPLHGLVKTRDRRRLVARQAQGFGLAVRHPSSTGSTAGEPKGNLFAGIVDTPTQSASPRLLPFVLLASDHVGAGCDRKPNGALHEAAFGYLKV